MQENELPGTPKELLRANLILTSALISGVVIFSLLVLVLMHSMPKLADMDQVFIVAVGGIALVCFISALRIYNNRIKIIKEGNLTIYQKLIDHRTALITYFALCEGAALFAVIGLMLTANYWFTLIIAVMLLAMFMKIPLKERVINDLELNWQEQQKL